MMYLRYVAQVIVWGFAIVGGFIGGYFLARYMNIGESIWGNSVDGYDGDVRYKNKEALVWFRKMWPSWWWSVMRNPANNLARRLAAKGTVLKIVQKGNLKIVTMTNNKRYFFYFTPNNKLMWKLGHKLWDSLAVEGVDISGDLAFSLQRGKG